MDGSNLVVVGASAGGVDALQAFAAGLPADFPAPLCVVLHVGAHRSELPALLNKAGPLPAVHPADGDPIEAGHIYVAPPDRHMIVDRGVVRLTKGPRENWARPAIDPLFCSAAAAYGPDAIGVILTGNMNDGVAGLHEVKRQGGVAVVQDPDDAANPSMPRGALANVAVDRCLPLAAIPGYLVDLVAERAAARDHRPQFVQRKGQRMTAEYTLDQPLTVTCPDCGGALRREEIGTLTRYHCHIGHSYTAEVMLAGQFLALERFIESAMRSMSERADLCRQMSDKARALGDAPAGANWEAAMHEAREETAPLRRLLERQWLRPETEAGTMALGDACVQLC